MSAINNLDGKRVKDGRVLHNEKVAPGVYFTVFALFDPADSRLLLFADMTSGTAHTYGNGVVAMDKATVLRTAKAGEKLPGLDVDLATADGLRAFQKIGQVYENKDGSKQRRDQWWVEVPKDKLLAYLN